MTTPLCEQFDEQADDLALGLVEEPRRSELLAHAAVCPRCQSLLDGLGTVVDRLLLLTPGVEPPAGFESRVLARVAAPGTSGRHRFRVPLWTVAAIVLVAGASVITTARLVDRPARAVPTATIISASGAEVGSVQLRAAPRPYVLITVAAPRPGTGLRNCELQGPDGAWVKVGSWDVADIASGVWATGIDPALLAATGMRITLDDGTVLATASFD